MYGRHQGHLFTRLHDLRKSGPQPVPLGPVSCSIEEVIGEEDTSFRIPGEIAGISEGDLHDPLFLSKSHKGKVVFDNLEVDVQDLDGVPFDILRPPIRKPEGTFLHGKMHGTWVDWYVNGQRAQESCWVYGKRDGTWTQWDVEGRVKNTEKYDHRSERDMGYSIHTDRETEEIVRSIQRKRLQRNWENLVGKTLASLVKPWQIACWVIFFLVSFSLINAKTPWRSAGLAGIVALFITSVMVWIYDRKRND